MFKREIWDKFTEFTFLKFWNLPSETCESLQHVINQKSHVYSWNLSKIYLVHFLKFWNLPRFTREISKFQKSELGTFISISLLNMWLLVLIKVDIRMFLEWENKTGKLQIISREFQNSGEFQRRQANFTEPCD